MTHKKRKMLFQKFIEVYSKSAGNVSHTCKAIGISRNCFYEWRKNYPEFDEQVVEIEEAMIDLVETKLMTNINEGKTAEILFFLKTKGKSRGWIESVENINKNVDVTSQMSEEQILNEIERLSKINKI